VLMREVVVSFFFDEVRLRNFLLDATKKCRKVLVRENVVRCW
jgi:hypothetical protein